ncbi:MAG TPA: hypothetical protein VJN94_02255, partial [Candidatus Binataceae bacterium]|nr:hypothetical protein [Candidatus Binataceae bacterium]
MIPRNRYLPRWDFLSRSLVRDSWWFYDFNEVGFKRGSYYRPLQDIWMGLNYHLWGLNPHLWHLPMIALHLVAVWLVYKLARLLSGSGPAALIAALLFGLLPIHADAIVWPSAVPLPMSAVFQLGAFYLFAVRAQNAARNWTLALLLYVGALLSHESATIFPGLIAAYALLLEPSTDISRPVVARTPELSRTADSDIWKRSAIETAPFVLLVIAYLGLRWLVLGYVGDLPSRPVSASTSEVIATVPWAWLHFVEITLLPWMAGPSHRVLYVASWTSPKFLLSLVIFAPAAGWLSFGRFAKQRLYLFCAIWFFLPLIPEIALIPTHQEAFVQDRYLYLASFAWCLVIADAVTAFAVATTAERKATFIAVAALAGLYAITLFRVQRFWLNDLSYFGECVAEFPEMPIYHHNLSTALVHASRLPEALDQMNIAVTLAPKSGYLLWERGLLDALMGRYTDAMRDKLEAASMKPRTKASDYVTLAEDADKAGEPTEVKAALQAAEALPDANRQAQMARAQ